MILSLNVGRFFDCSAICRHASTTNLSAEFDRPRFFDLGVRVAPPAFS